MSLANSPRVSVVMPTYNVEAYIEVATRSILQQTFTNFELIVIDDGSADDTWAILERIAAQDARIILHRNPANLGISRTRNLGIDLARGEYIAVMDHDDISLPERLEKQVAYMDAHPEVGAVGGAIRFLQGKALSAPRTYRQTPGLIAWTICFDIPSWHPACMVRRSALLAVGGYDPAYTVSNDHDLWLRLSQQTGLANLPDVVLHYRRHDSSFSRQRIEVLRHETSTIVQRAIEVEIGVRLTQPEALRLVWGFHSPAIKTDKMAAVLHQLAHGIEEKHHLTPAECRIVQQDAARRLLLVLRHRPDIVSATATLFYAFRFAPLYSVRRLCLNVWNYSRRQLVTRLSSR